MFSDYSRDLLRSGIIEAKAGNREAARRYLDRAVYMSGDHDVMAEAWYWLSQVSGDPVERRSELENCLANDLDHARARRALAILDGKLRPDEIVNADALPAEPSGFRQVDAGRFMCPRCGGRMTYRPDGDSLVCEYCLRHEALKPEEAKGGTHDFFVAMATERGHGKPLREQIAHCQGCGAQFILPAGQISFTCAYCGSPHVVNVDKSNDLLAPDRIVPHAFDQAHAADLLRDWVDRTRIEPDKGVEPPRGSYLPAWTFSVGGGIDYTAEVPAEVFDANTHGNPHVQHVSDRFAVQRDISIAASCRASATFVRLLPEFDLKRLQAYDPRYLAAWPAELYDVSMADASMESRSQAYASLKREMPTLVWPARLVSTSSANLTIEEFHLDLMPVWMTEIALEGRRRLVLINGQTGSVHGEGFMRSDKARRGLLEWLADLLGE
jgi:predicted RNA-binding Zn-ribbon protein involved in translation (DUF1610 family)